MNLSDYTESQTQFFDALKPLLASSDASSKLIAEAARELLSIQSDLAAPRLPKRWPAWCLRSRLVTPLTRFGNCRRTIRPSWSVGSMP
jgi:hypothetical protein